MPFYLIVVFAILLRLESKTNISINLSKSSWLPSEHLGSKYHFQEPWETDIFLLVQISVTKSVWQMISQKFISCKNAYFAG